MENEVQKPQPVHKRSGYITLEEYLKMDADSERKVEYLDGEVFVNLGETVNHNRIASHILGEVGNQLDKSRCTILPGQMRVASPDFESFTYPDASIVCGKIKLFDNIFDTLVNPTIIFEVVSASSIANDYRTKFWHYKQIPSLQEYVLVDSFENICINIFRRQPNNQWLNETYLSLDETLVLQSVNISVSLAELYENVSFEPKEEI